MLGTDLKRYLLAIVVPAVLITFAGLYFLHLQNKHDSIIQKESRHTRIENLAAEFQDALRDVPPVEGARFNRLKEIVSNGLTSVNCGIYEWKPSAGVVRSWKPSAGLEKRISKLTRWNEWTSDGKKSARRGVMAIGVSEKAWLLWCRLDGSVYALAYSSVPYQEPPPSLLWPVGLCLVLLAAGVLCSGGVMLWRAAEKARRANTMKTTFVSNISHELKTPLTALHLWTGLLENGSVGGEEDRRRAYSILSSETRRLLRMVDELLDYTRLEQGRKKYNPVPVDMGRLLLDAAQFSESAYPGLCVSAEIDGEVVAVADEDAVRQIIHNLLENARRYAASGGGATLRARCSNNTVEISVLDRGPGMSEHDRKNAFTRFYRGDSAQGAKIGGQGLGLPISRALALDMGGDLKVDERTGGGCAFVLLLPRCRDERWRDS